MSCVPGWFYRRASDCSSCGCYLEAFNSIVVLLKGKGLMAFGTGNNECKHNNGQVMLLASLLIISSDDNYDN